MKFPTNLSNIRYLGHNKNFSCRFFGEKQQPERYAKKAITELLGIQEVTHNLNNYHRCEKTEDTLYAELKKNQPEYKKPSTCKYYKQALDLLVKDINTTEKFKIITFDGLAYVPQNLTASAELPYILDYDFRNFVKKRFSDGEIQNYYPTKGNGLAYIHKIERNKIEDIKKGKLSYAQTDLTRVHSKSPLTPIEKNKLRLISGTPVRTIYIEMMLLHALNHHLQRSKNSIAWGYEVYKGGLMRLHDDFIGYNTFMSLDFTAFDKRIPHWLIKDIHKVWQSLSSLTECYSDPSHLGKITANEDETQRLWQYISEAATQERCIMPDGHMFERKHSGFGSGLYQTQLLGSHINFVMINAAMLECGFAPNMFEIKVLGDDSVVAFNYDKSPKELLKRITAYLLEEFNAIVNVEKSVTYKNVKNLQFLSYKLIDGEIARVKNDLLARLLLPEKNGKYTIEKTKTRTLGIMISNFGYNEKVHRVCIRILEMLKDVEIDLNHINLYDRFRLQTMFCKNIPDYPTCAELKEMALVYNTMYDNEYKFEDFFR
ncbi:hypothetical protein BDAP_001973 [Binucleata daphniae]